MDDRLEVLELGVSDKLLVSQGAGTPAPSGYTPGLNAQPVPAPTTPSGPTVTTQTSSPAPGGQGGSQPSTGNIFNSDPGVAYALQQEQAGIPKITTELASLISQRIANYGDPSIAAMAGFGLDPQSAAFAQQNYLSGNAELARIDTAHKQNLQKVINTLAGHGLVFSGDTGYQTGLENQSYGNTVYDAQQKALSDVLGLIQNSEAQKQQLENNLASAYEQAYQTYVSNPAYAGFGGGGGATQAPPPANVQPFSPAGQPLSLVANPAAVKVGVAAVKNATSAGTKAVAKQLANAYTTGQKKRG